MSERKTCKTCRWNEKPLDFHLCRDCAQLAKGGGVEMTRWEAQIGGDA